MNRVSRVTPVVLLLLAVGSGLLGWYFADKGERLDRFGITTGAVVAEQGTPGKHGHSTRVTFVTGKGERPEVPCDTCTKDLRKGERLDIRYDPQNPFDPVEQAGHPAGPEGARFFWIGAAALLALAVLTTWLRIRQTRAARPA
ncbi:hypothetical protein Dvina_38080 [Dactylosporangium vinaceum]|uniref:DUF3592 domain-containing protein n=1 Tax=Dactylosporangium vinaceum TaxID=53362 RepID=A0ABV5ML10_9ACTN|nr:DUF3592 domain-containing protein [Dactylosporangium vinaceum]UAB93963.1 hypothetical protein Dvina_38080 [Dactylosporangium vinaceum]